MKGLLEHSQGTLSPEPPGIFRLGAYRKDDKRKDDNLPSSPFRISTRRGARGASPQSPILRPSNFTIRKAFQYVKHVATLTINQGPWHIT